MRHLRLQLFDNINCMLNFCTYYRDGSPISLWFPCWITPFEGSSYLPVSTLLQGLRSLCFRNFEYMTDKSFDTDSQVASCFDTGRRWLHFCKARCWEQVHPCQTRAILTDENPREHACSLVNGQEFWDSAVKPGCVQLGHFKCCNFHS